MQTPDVLEETRATFVRYMGEFLSALCDQYPDSSAVQRVRLAFGVGIDHAISDGARVECETNLITEYHESMAPYYDRVAKRDESVMADIDANVPFVHDLGIKAMWSGADPDTKDCIYEYLDLMNRFSRMYALYRSVPTGLMSHIADAATKMADNISVGGSLDPAELIGVGETVIGKVDEADLAQFATTMLGQQDQLRALMSVVSKNVDGNIN